MPESHSHGVPAPETAEMQVAARWQFEELVKLLQEEGSAGCSPATRTAILWYLWRQQLGSSDSNEQE